MGNLYWDEFKFCLDRPGGNGAFEVVFGDNYTPVGSKDEDPVEANAEYIGAQLLRLESLDLTLKKDEGLMEKIPKHEWDTAWRYHDAMMISISAALLASGLIGDEGVKSNLAVSGEYDDEEEDSGGGEQDVKMKFKGRVKGQEARDEL